MHFDKESKRNNEVTEITLMHVGWHVQEAGLSAFNVAIHVSNTVKKKKETHKYHLFFMIP